MNLDPITLSIVITEYKAWNMSVIMADLQGCCEADSGYSVIVDKLNCLMNFTSVTFVLSSGHPIIIKNPIVNFSVSYYKS